MSVIVSLQLGSNINLECKLLTLRKTTMWFWCKNLFPFFQGMSFLANIAAENDLHKDAVMDCILPVSPDLNISSSNSFLVNFLQSKERLLRLSSLWCLVNLVYPNHKNSLKNSLRVSSLHSAGIISQLKTMVHDPCLDCKVDPFPLKEFTLRS